MIELKELKSGITELLQKDSEFVSELHKVIILRRYGDELVTKTYCYETTDGKGKNIEKIIVTFYTNEEAKKEAENCLTHKFYVYKIRINKLFKKIFQ